MGAIAILLSRASPPDEETAGRMLAAAPHRGTRQTVEVLGRAALGVCNDDDWVTATVARDHGRLAVFCGALDNDADLRAELRRGGAPPPKGPTPAAALLAAFSTWGDDAVRRLRGSFAGAITDGHVVKCFRDQFGARPLFYHDGSAGFFAATEVKQVLAGASIPREPDLAHCHSVLFGGVGRSTAFRGVQRIPKAAITSTGSEPGLRSAQYWDPTSRVETARLRRAAALEGTLEALDRAVRRVLTGRDAILLSGGLDSPALAAFAARAEGLDNPVQAVTATYPDYPTVDERDWTRMAAVHLGMPLHEFVAEAGSMDGVEHWVRLLDGPVDVLSIPESAESYTAARAVGARMVMNGEIAEMLFGGRSFLLDHLLWHGRLGAAIRTLGGPRRVAKRPLQAGREIAKAMTPAAVSAYLHRKPVQLRGLPSWVDERKLTTSRRSPSTWSMRPRQRWIRMQTAPFIGPGIAFEADEICAAVCGVDSRRPFADVDLWEFVLGLPAEVKFPNRRTKPLLREVMRGLLPDELIDRKDKTFFDEFHLAKADYGTLRRLLVDPRHRVEGIDYSLLRDRIEAGDMGIYELQWARNVARVHAFLNQW